MSATDAGGGVFYLDQYEPRPVPATAHDLSHEPDGAMKGDEPEGVPTVADAQPSTNDLTAKIETNEEDEEVTIEFSRPIRELQMSQDEAEEFALQVLNHARGHK